MLKHDCAVSADGLFARICALLDAAGVAYRTVRHEPTHTSEESARARGEDVRIGGKALLLKVGDEQRPAASSVAPQRTADGVALARGTPSASARVFDRQTPGADAAYKLFVLSAALKMDSAAVKQRFGVRKVRFATAEELREQTGLGPGSVPPFGPPILPYELLADESVLANERIAFNAGSLTDSIVMDAADWQRVARPVIFRFAAVAQ